MQISKGILLNKRRLIKRQLYIFNMVLTMSSSIRLHKKCVPHVSYRIICMLDDPTTGMQLMWYSGIYEISVGVGERLELLQDRPHLLNGIDAGRIRISSCSATQFLGQCEPVDMIVQAGQVRVEEDAINEFLCHEGLHHFKCQVEEDGGIDNMSCAKPQGKTVLERNCFVQDVTKRVWDAVKTSSKTNRSENSLPG